MSFPVTNRTEDRPSNPTSSVRCLLWQWTCTIGSAPKRRLESLHPDCRSNLRFPDHRRVRRSRGIPVSHGRMTLRHPRRLRRFRPFSSVRDMRRFSLRSGPRPITEHIVCDHRRSPPDPSARLAHGTKRPIGARIRGACYVLASTLLSVASRTASTDRAGTRTNHLVDGHVTNRMCLRWLGQEGEGEDFEDSPLARSHAQ